MKIILSLGLMIFSFKSFSQAGQGDCGMTLTLSNPVVTSSPLGQTIQQNYTIRRSSNNNTRCRFYRLYFSQGLANSYQRKAFKPDGNSYDYNLHGSSNLNGILKSFNDALSPSEYIRRGMPARNTNFSDSFFIFIPATTTQNNPPAGTYTDNLNVSVYRENNAAALALQLTSSLTTLITVPNQIDVSLVDTGGAYDQASTFKTLDFGNLQQNTELGTDLVVDSNTPYQIRLSSFNDGVMKNDNEVFNYQLTFNSSPINLVGSLASPVNVISSNPTRGIQDRYQIKVKLLSDPDVKPAGLYQDSITISAIAN